MQINVSKNSWHARIYRWYFDADHLPSSLCPYFWGYVLIVPTLPPLLVMGIPAYLFFLAMSLWNQEKPAPMNPWASAILSFLSLIVCIVMVAGIEGFVHLLHHKKPGENEEAAMAFVVCIIILVFVVCVFNYAGRRRKNNPYYSYNYWYETIGRFQGATGFEDWYKWIDDNHRTSVFRLIIEGIRAIYKKACPIINWR